jgi:hypothetical protein
MHMQSNYIVYPEGDLQEIDHNLSFNQYVGLNGEPLGLPLASPRTIVYKVYSIRRSEGKGETETYYYLELVTGAELRSLALE